MNKEFLSDKDVYLARLLSRLLYALLSISSSGKILSINYQVNSMYLRLCGALEKIVGSKFRRPFESLFLIAEDIDIEWNKGTKAKFRDFMGWLDSEFTENGSKRFSLKNDYNKEYYSLVLNAYSLLKSYRKYKNTVEDAVNIELKELEKSVLKEEPNNKCWFEENAFYIRLAGNTIGSLVFETTKDKHKTLETFRIIYDYWNTNAEEGKVNISRDFLISELGKKGIRENDDNINDIVSYLRKKIKRRKLDSVLLIGNHNKKLGYSFEISQPS